jgi:CHASE3 domain sensor protein
MKRTSPAITVTRKTGLDPAVSLGLAAVLLFFVISGGIACVNLQTVGSDNAKVVHSHEVASALDKLRSNAQDAETGQRGFLLTGKESYLEPYDAAIASLPSQVDEVAQLTRDEPAQQNRIGPLRAHVVAKLAELRQTIDLRRANEPQAALNVVDTDRGKVEMDAIRGQLAAMGQEEATQRDQRLSEMSGA